MAPHLPYVSPSPPPPPAQRLLHRLPWLLRALQDGPGHGPMVSYLPYVSPTHCHAAVNCAGDGVSSSSEGNLMHSLQQVWAGGGEGMHEWMSDPQVTDRSARRLQV